MKKIGLCCCYKQRNYGSQLQSYATTVEMRNRNIPCEVIQHTKKWDLHYMRVAKVWTFPFNRVLLSERYLRYKKRFVLMFHKDVKAQNDKRNAKLAEFSKKRFTNLSRPAVGYKDLQALASEYSGVFVGSDQLWSPGGITGNFHNLMFVPDDVHKFSYATSFGVSSLPKNKRELYRTFLNRLDYISVRENAGAEIVKDVCGRTAEVVADPVMLLTTEQWAEEIPFRRKFRLSNNLTSRIYSPIFWARTTRDADKRKSCVNKRAAKLSPCATWIPTTKWTLTLAITLPMKWAPRNLSI